MLRQPNWRLLFLQSNRPSGNSQPRLRYRGWNQSLLEPGWWQSCLLFFLEYCSHQYWMGSNDYIKPRHCPPTKNCCCHWISANNFSKKNCSEKIWAENQTWATGARSLDPTAVLWRPPNLSILIISSLGGGWESLSPGFKSQHTWMC